MTTLAEKIAVMQAFERGEKIETLITNGEWIEVSFPMWDWQDCDYRIAPKPKKTIELYQWLCYDSQGFLPGYWASSHHSVKPNEFALCRLDETRMVVEVEDHE